MPSLLNAKKMMKTTDTHQDDISSTHIADEEIPASAAAFSSANFQEADLLPLPSPHRHKKLLIIILTIVLSLLILLLIYSVAAKNFTLYARTMKHLRFDYRQGEISDAPLDDITPALADDIKEQIDAAEQGVRIQATAMLFNENGTYTPTLTLYDYYHSLDAGATDTITTRTCAEYWFPTETTDLMQTDDGSCMVKLDGEWVQTDELHIPNLYDYCFATTQTKGVAHYASYYSQVCDMQYLCEIWLIEEEGDEGIIYNTVYRYYSGGKLCAVRLLPSYSTNMLVFDITDYCAE